MAELTFIVPSVGRRTVLRTLASLQALKNQNWLALVGFDGVNDKTIDALKLPIDARITYVRLPKKLGRNNYGGAVRNMLIAQSSTAWVAFVDDDDTLRPEYVDTFLSERGAAKCIMFRMSYNRLESKVIPPLEISKPCRGLVGISFAVDRTFLSENNLQFVNNGSEDYVLLKSIHAILPMQFSKSILYNVRH